MRLERTIGVEKLGVGVRERDGVKDLKGIGNPRH